MGRYIKKFSSVGAVGPNEERGFALWVGYDIVGVDEDLSAAGLTRVDGWSADELAKYEVTSFARVERDDKDMYEKLGIGGKRR